MLSPSKSIYKILLIISMCLYSNVLVSQTFSKVYYTNSGDRGRAVTQTLDGGYATIGYSSGFTGNGDVLLLKLDAYGDTLWYKVFGHTATKQEGFDLKQSSDGSFLITGYSHSGSYGNDTYLIKTDSYGTLLWEVIYNISGDQKGKSLLELSNGDMVIAGSTTLSGVNYSFVLKTDSNGNEIWTSLHPGEARGIAEAPNGDIMMVGKVISSAGDENAILARLDSNGNTVWETEAGDANNNVANDIVTLANGNFAITGYAEAGPADYLKDLYVSIMDINGVFLDYKTHGVSNKPEIGNSIVEAADGGLVVAGRAAICGDNWGDMYLVKFDSKIGLEWEQCYGGPPNNQDEAYDVSLTDDDGFIVSGRANGHTSTEDIYIVKTDSNGNTSSLSRLDIVALDIVIGKKEIEAIFDYNNFNNEELSITIFDVYGRPVDYKKYYNQLNLQENSSLPLGVYIYRISDENGKVLNKGKLLIE